MFKHMRIMLIKNVQNLQQNLKGITGYATKLTWFWFVNKNGLTPKNEVTHMPEVEKSIGILIPTIEVGLCLVQ
jgi:hypothetical protein